VGLASLAGWGLGALVDLPGTGAWLGALAGAVPVAAVDAWRSIRVLAWLRDPSGREPPALDGRWGEAAYRVERLIKAGEQRVTEERQRLHHFLSAIEASPNGVMLLDAGDHIQWLNSVAAQHFGLSPTRDLQQRLTNLVRNPLFVSHLQTGLFERPVVFTDAQGQRTLSVVVRAFAENQRLVLSQDVTEALRAEAMRRDFVANVSHEIRTPLTVLSGFIETLDTLDLSAKERRRVLDLMARQAERMQSLVADLLTLAQLEGSPLPAADRWHDLGSLLQQVADDGRALSAGRQTIEVVLDAAAEVAGNRPELVSAVSNLVNNAVRYTQDGGHIVLRLLARGSGDIEIAVEDNGPGIPREHLSRLTERFYRVDSSRSRETGGTGLGLAIVKHVVQRHGGSLDVDSEVGKGSRFRIVLPAARVRLAALAAGA
jgi:two-component system phosphate regulon sensor histidine kinase PhoR